MVRLRHVLVTVARSEMQLVG